MKNLATTFWNDDWVLLPLRFMLGFGFVAHGYAKLARGPENFAVILAAMGIPVPGFTAWATSLIEFLGGVALMLGIGVIPVSIPLAIIMLTALFGVHLRYGFSSVRLQGISSTGAVFGPVGYELNLLYVAGLLSLALSRLRRSGSLARDHKHECGRALKKSL